MLDKAPIRTRIKRAQILGVFCVLLVASGNLPFDAPSTARRSAVIRQAPAALADEDPEGRSDWFMSQRLYPFDSLPVDARRKAVETSRPTQPDGSVIPAAEQRWRAIGPSPTNSFFMRNWGVTSGRVNAVAVSPANPRIVLAGSSTGGIWRSTDAGASFTATSDNQVDLAVGSIAFSKSNSSVVYVGMGDIKGGYLGSGVLKSTDAGRSWQRTSNNTLPSPGTVSKIEVDPTDPNRVYLAQYSKLSPERVISSGFYRSTDGGVSWARTFTGPARDLAIDATDRQTIYLGIARGDQKENSPPAGLYRSTDGGGSWTQILATPYDQYRTRDVKVGVTPANPQLIYVYMGGFFSTFLDIRLVVSTDGGATWTNRPALEVDSGQFGYNTYLHVDPAASNTIYVGSRDLYKSTDGGARWTNLTKNFSPGFDSMLYTPGISTTHPDQHAFAVSPDNPNVIYLGNDGGVYKSTDGAASFQSLNSTLTLTQFTSIALHPTDPNITYGGTQDNGTQKRSPGLTSWSEFASGDGGRCIINPLDPSMVFLGYVRGNIFRYRDDGRSFDAQVSWNSTFGEPDTGARIAFYPPITGNGVDATLYFGTWRLFISTNLGETWSSPASEVDLTRGITERGNDFLTAIGVSRSNPNVIYTGSSQGRSMSSANGGASWTDITAGLPDRFITSIMVHPFDSAIAYLTVSGFGSGHVFKTTNSGVTWTNISGNLPDIPVNTLLMDTGNTQKFYAGSDVGVFQTTDGGAGWQRFDRGMPPAVVTAFTSQPSGLIQVATYGRGAYELMSDPAGPPPPPGPIRPVVSAAVFDGKKTLTIGGEGFGNNPTVLINDTNKNSRIKSASAAELKLKGKIKKLELKAGDNTLVVIDSDGRASNTYILRL